MIKVALTKSPLRIITSFFYLYLINFVSGIPEFFIPLTSVNPESSICLAFVRPDFAIEPFNMITLLSSTVPIKIYPNADLDKERIILENKDKAGVYQFINLLTGDSYVGSSTNLSRRLRQYYSYSFISSPARGKSIIFSSILRNGYSNFSLTILEYCEINDSMNREQFYIDVILPSMNILQIAGNSLGYKHTKESIAKISYIKKDSCFGSNNGFYSKQHTLENRKLLSEIAKARPKSPNAKSVILSDSNHIFIQEFKSMTALSLFLKADKGTLAKYRELGKLFRGLYYIKSISKE